MKRVAGQNIYACVENLNDFTTHVKFRESAVVTVDVLLSYMTCDVCDV